LSNGVGDGVEGSGRGFADEAFEFGEELLDRVEVGVSILEGTGDARRRP
jgi:hypothetical protein